MDATRFPLPPPPSRAVPRSKTRSHGGGTAMNPPRRCFSPRGGAGGRGRGDGGEESPGHHVPEHQRTDGFGCWAARCDVPQLSPSLQLPKTPKPVVFPSLSPLLAAQHRGAAPHGDVSGTAATPVPIRPSACPDRVPCGDRGRGHGPGGPGGAGTSSSSGISPVSAAEGVRPPWCLGSGWNECMHIPLPQHVCLLFSSAAVID